MPLTNFPEGLSSFGIPVAPGIPLPYTGRYIWVQEPSGYSTAAPAGGQGTQQQPYTRLDTAVSAATSGNNDVIMLLGTVHLDATLTWNKDKLHMIGVCAPLMRGKRARISAGTPLVSTYYTPMVSVTGQGCQFYNFGTFYGIADNSALICWADSGGRNSYDNVEFLGFGSTNTAAQTTSRTFVLSGSTGECTFRNCVFGVDTIARTAANYTLEITGGSPRNTFDGCRFECLATGGGSGAAHLLVGSGGIDRYLDFKNCIFGNSTGSTGSTLTQMFSVHASAGGNINCIQTWFNGATNVETTASNRVFMGMTAPAATDSGLLVANAP
jgi:hypothetical protein